MDIVDAQIHMGPGRIEETVAQMDALGIRGAIVDEYWLTDFSGQPFHAFDGGRRPVAPTAELASRLHPDRFAWLLRVHPADPEYASIIRQVRDALGARALRIDPGLSPATSALFAQGGYDHLLAAAADSGLPVFAFAPDQPEAFARAAAAFPGLRLIVDHCGLYSNGMRATIGGGRPALDAEGQLAMFDRVLALAEYPNIALKWGHASAMFDQPVWPGHGLWPILRRAISALGADRVMWASDFSVNQRGECWAQLLYGQLADPGLSAVERAQVFGGTVRTWLGWPAA